MVDATGRRFSPTRSRRPDDGKVERISLRAGTGAAAEEAVFVAAGTGGADVPWRLAALILKNWGYRAKWGRPVNVSFSVRFGDGVSYTGTVQVSRSKRPDLAAFCRTPEAFQQAFAPDLTKKEVRSMLRFFLDTYEIPTSTARLKQ